MGFLDDWQRAGGAKLEQLYDQLLCSLRDLTRHTRDVETGTTGTARTLAYQYGTPPATGTARLAPRSMTALPLVAEGELSGQRVTLDLLEQQGRYGYAGYVANIGDDPIKAAWVGVDGANSGFFTLPPSATVQVPCIVRAVMFEGAAGAWQVSIS